MSTLSEFLDRLLGVPAQQPRPVPIPVRDGGPRR